MLRDEMFTTAIIGDKTSTERNLPATLAIANGGQRLYFPRGTEDEVVLAGAKHADVLLVDAIGEVSRTLIEGMPNLKMVHSMGVGYEHFDVSACTENGVYLCNCKGMNAGAVAEQAILLMLGLLRGVVSGHKAVLDGRQIQTKERKFTTGITDLADCTVGILGFGDIGKATAERLSAFGCRVIYYSRHRRSEEEERALGVTYVEEDELLAESDIVSLHLASNAETANYVDAAFLAKMKPTALLINTSRGELVDNEALCEALEKGAIGGAGLDTIAPEPVTKENPLVTRAEKFKSIFLYSPHIAGITTGSMRRGNITMWENTQRIYDGETPINIVNAPENPRAKK